MLLLTSLSYHLSLRLSFLSIFEWPLKTDFTVTKKPILTASSCTHMCICINVGTPLSADNLCKCFELRLKPFNTLIVFMKEFFEKVDFEKISR